MTFAYLDTSAFVKTIAEEPESARLESWLGQWPRRASCALIRTEAIRALAPYGSEVIAAARAQFGTLRIVRLESRLLDSAGDLRVDLRTLDAVHVAAALALGPDLGVLVTYDSRMESAARELGIAVAAP
ncbi:MAG: type II toxin-antitoxin system VapC family toxin [Gaiellaceae bacterium]